MSQHRIKTAKVDVCALCGWRGPAREWAGHLTAYLHLNMELQANARAAGYVKLEDERRVEYVKQALGPNSAVYLKDSTGTFSDLPFVRVEVSTAIDVYYSLPSTVRRSFKLKKYLTQMFPTGCPVQYAAPSN